MSVMIHARAKRSRCAFAGVLLASAGASMPGLAAAAETAPVAVPDAFTVADLDGSGGIDRKEHFSYVASQFMAYDTNDDGRLSRDEMKHPRDVPRFDHADADGDGHLALDEIVAWANGDFDGLDANKNGVLERSETES